MNDSDRKTVRQFSIMVGLLVLVAVVLVSISMLVHNHEPKETDPHAAGEVAARIAPSSAVYAGDTGRAAMAAAAAAEAQTAEPEYGGTTDGKEIFDHLCTSCHTAGVTGAPKVGDKADWAPRLAGGIDTLVKHAIEGYHGPDGNFMPPKGGNAKLSDEQVTNAVHWMIDQVK